MNFNRVILLGRLTRDPELSYTTNQVAIVNFGMAINRKFTKKDGSQQEEVCFVDLVGFAKTAENLNKYLKKGDPLMIEGRLVFESWTAQDGTKRNKHKVVIESFQFLSSGEKQSEKPKQNEMSY